VAVPSGQDSVQFSIYGFPTNWQENKILLNMQMNLNYGYKSMWNGIKRWRRGLEEWFKW
jgi:hypothetical protein